MAGHPFAAHREHHVEKQRVAHIAKHRASGGGVHSDEKQDRKLFKKMIAEHDREAEGKKSKHRRDRVARAKGGKVGKKGRGATHVNVIVGAQHPNAPAPMMAPHAPMVQPPAPPAAPPVPPAAMAGLAGAPGVPPMRARGGRTHRADGGKIDSGEEFPGGIMDQMRHKSTWQTQNAPQAQNSSKGRARGGALKSGPAYEEGRKAGTPVQHSPALSSTIKNMGRGKAVTFSHGGKVESPQGVSPATKLPGGGGGGAGRRAKIGKYAVGSPMKEVNAAR